MNYDVVIIGAGAAGLMTACLAAKDGAKVLVLEKNDRPGKKLRITGKGRCNVTNDTTPSEVIKNIPTGGKFLYSAVNAFPPEEVKSYFEKLGVPLKTERGNRVFPESDNAQDVVDALYNEAKKNGVKFSFEKAVDILVENGAVKAVKTASSTYEAEACVLATGGMSYPATGSSGDGLRFSEKLGHTVSECIASLVPLVSDNPDCRDLCGLSLKNIGITVTNSDNKQIYKDFGEMLFTHFGVSGPVVLSASSHMRDYSKNRYKLVIDLKPALDEDTLEKRVLKDFSKYINKNFINSLHELLPSKMIPVIVKRSGISPETKVNSITREQRRSLCRVIKNFEIEITGTRPIDEAIITSGGVSLKEINPRTMESKLIQKLYFAGEIIDADAYTGGFNLQIAWSTAFVAARSAVNCKGE